MLHHVFLIFFSKPRDYLLTWTTRRGCVLITGISEEVARHESPHAFDLRHIEPVVVHLAIHVDDLTRLET